MALAVDAVSVADHDHRIAPGMPIPGAREPGMLTPFRSSVPRVQIPEGPNTMDATTIAKRQREGAEGPVSSVPQVSGHGMVRSTDCVNSWGQPGVVCLTGLPESDVRLTRALRRRSTSTPTPSMRHTARPSRRSSANCSSFWTPVDYKRRQGWKTFHAQVTL